MTGRARANGEGSIFPYRNGFAAYAWVTTPAGDRKRKYVYGKTREAVHAKWVKLQDEASKRPVATKVPTLSEYLVGWLRDVVEPNLAPSTYVNYGMFVRLYIVPELGSRRLDNIGAREVRTWLNCLRRACQCCTQGKDAKRPEDKRRCCSRGPAYCCGAALSLRTVGDVRAALRSALSNAVTEDLIGKNPITAVKLPRGRKRHRKALTSDEARSLLESARDESDPLYAVYVLILVLGLRRGEVLGLTWDDVDLDVRELTVRLQIQRVGGQLLHRETKTEASDAPLPLPEVCVTALRHQRVRRDELKQRAGKAWHELGLVFTTRYGTPIEPRNLARSYETRLRKAGVRRITLHDARRTCATLLADLDVHPRVAMQILRHADFKVTMEVYTQVTSQQTREALRRLGESLDG